MDLINISKIIKNKNIKNNLPTQFNKTEQISAVYTLTKTIRSKIFNHKDIRYQGHFRQYEQLAL